MKKYLNRCIKGFVAFTCVVTINLGSWTVFAIDEPSLEQMIANVESGGTVTIEADYTLSQPIVISKEVTLRSDNSNTILAEGTRHFSVVGGSLTLEGITLDGNNTGGGIEVSENQGTLGHLILGENTILQNNYSSTDGGAISGNGALIDLLEGSQIQNNKAGMSADNTTSGFGGGVYLTGVDSKLTMHKGSYVSYNAATNRGGGIAIVDSNATISGTLDGNEAYRMGGGIFFQQATQSLEVDSATIINNRAYNYISNLSFPPYASLFSGGGGVSVVVVSNSTNPIKIHDSKIMYNVSETSTYESINGGVGYYVAPIVQGGGIAVYTSNEYEPLLEINGSEISHNFAGHGGGIYANIRTLIMDTILDGNKAEYVKDNTYESENKRSSGGAIYFKGSNTKASEPFTLSIEGGVISDNTATDGAGIGYSASCLKDIKVTETQFTGNATYEHGYEWDLTNPMYDEIEGISDSISYTQLYKSNINNVSSFTEPYSNLYNNVDLSFSLDRIVQFDANGGVFDESANDYFNYLYEINQCVTSVKDDEVVGKNMFSLRFPTSASLETGLKPVREGYTFIGWQDATGKTLSDKTLILSHTKYNALWQALGEEPTIIDSELEDPKVEKPEVEIPEVVKPEVEKPVVDKPEVEKPVVDKPEVVKPEVERPTVEESKQDNESSIVTQEKTNDTVVIPKISGLNQHSNNETNKANQESLPHAGSIDTLYVMGGLMVILGITSITVSLKSIKRKVS